MTTKERKAVLFFTPFGWWQVHNHVDATVAAALKMRDVDIRYLTCEGFYCPCAMTREPRDCVRCRSSMTATLASQSIGSSPFSSFLTDADVAQADAWIDALPNQGLASAYFDDLPVGEWTLSTIMTHFRISQLEQLSRKDVIPVHRAFLRDSLLTFRAIDRALETRVFEALFVFNGRFYPYRAALEAARRRGLRALVHERGRVPNSFVFFENENVFGLKTPHQLIEAWSPYSLEGSEIAALENYFSHMLVGKNETWPSFYAQIRHDDPYRILDIPRGARLIGLFTSSTDEFAFQPGFGDVRRQFELIEKVAKAIAGTETYLVVRHHPFMAGGAGIPCDLTSFDEAFRQMLTRTENVRVIMPADQLTSYALFPYLAAAIVPFSSIAIELIAFGVPTLVSDASMIGFNERFILRDWSQESVRDALSFLMSEKAELDIETARLFYRHCYTTLFRISVSFRCIAIENFFKTVSCFEETSFLKPGQDLALDRVCDYLLTGEPVHAMPDRTRSYTLNDEDDFVVRQIAFVSDRRRALRREAVAAASLATYHNLAVLIDETIEGDFSERHWLALANARTIHIKTFGYKEIQYSTHHKWHQMDKFDISDDFLSWCHRLYLALIEIKQDFVLVTNARFQMHDASIASIVEGIGSAKLSRASVIELSGWVFDFPHQSYLKISPGFSLGPVGGEEPPRLMSPLRPRDRLGYIVAHRGWLSEILEASLTRSRPETEFEQMLISRSKKISTSLTLQHPVFLLR